MSTRAHDALEHAPDRLVTLPMDDHEAAFVALAEQLGGRDIVRRWVADLALVARLERGGAR